MARKIVLLFGIVLVIIIAILIFSFSDLIPIQFSPFNLSVQVGNSPPVVDFVNFTNIGAVEGGVRNVLINFTVSDANGVSDLNDSAVRVEVFNLSLTSAIRSNSTCFVAGNIDSDTRNYNCEVGMWYFDPYGFYKVNVTIADNSGNRSENSSRVFNYLSTSGIAISPSGLNWPPISVTDTNVNSSNDPLTSNNTGNVNFTIANLTAYNLPGSITSSKFIYAGNFSVNVTDSCLGNVLANNTGMIISGAGLSIGNLSIGGGTAQEQLYFCIRAINPDTPSETFSTANSGGNQWNLDFREI